MSINVCMPRAQRRRLQRLLRKTTSRIEALRARILLLLHAGHPVAEVAQLTGCVRATVYRTVYRYEDLGEDGLRDQRTQRTPWKVTPEMVVQLTNYLEGVPKDYGWHRAGWTLELLCLQLAADTGVRISCSSLHHVLRQSGYRRSRPRPGLRIPVQGRRKVLENIKKLIARASPEEEVLYQDEADLHLNPKLGYTYQKRGQQSLVLTPGKNEKRYLFGGLNTRTGNIVQRFADRKNSEQFIAFLEQLRQTYRRARHIHLVLDNYIIHKSKKTMDYLARWSGRIVLHFLPPYSPEENVIERLWKQMHDQVTRNHQHPTMASLVEDVEVFLNYARPFPGTRVSTLRMVA